MYIDGIRNSTSQNREMFAVEQVEVTKVLHQQWVVQVQLVAASI